MIKPTLLLDADGVLIDFVGGCIDAAHRRTTRTWTRDNFPTWDIFSEFVADDNPMLLKQLYKDIERKGFCASLIVFPGAVEAVKHLRSFCNVLCVTAPWYSSPYWMHERKEMLVNRFGFRTNEIIMTSSKDYVHGNILVDDKGENITKWVDYQDEHSATHVLGLLWDTPHNRWDKGIRRVTDWNEVDQLAKAIAQRDIT